MGSKLIVSGGAAPVARVQHDTSKMDVALYRGALMAARAPRRAFSYLNFKYFPSEAIYGVVA
jgi:hypothetical protein